MSKILILKSNRPNERSSAFDTWEALQKIGSDSYDLERLGDLAFVIKSGQIQCVSMLTGKDIASYDLVYIRDLGNDPIRNALGFYLQKRNVAFINEDAAIFSFNNKLLQTLAFAEAGLPIPDSFFVKPQHYAKAAEKFGFKLPVVAKSIFGSNGSNNELISDFSKLVNQALPPDSILQENIPNAFDYRIIVNEGSVMLAYKRIREPHGSNYKNNVAQGAKRELVNHLPEDIKRDAILAASLTRRQLAGVDILPHASLKRHYVLEVNYNFGMAEAGSKIANEYYEKLAKYFHKKASQ